MVGSGAVPGVATGVGSGVSGVTGASVVSGVGSGVSTTEGEGVSTGAGSRIGEGVGGGTVEEQPQKTENCALDTNSSSSPELVKP